MGIEIKNFSYKYPLEDKNVLENLNLKIEKGEFWAVIGKMEVEKRHFVML